MSVTCIMTKARTHATKLRRHGWSTLNDKCLWLVSLLLLMSFRPLTAFGQTVTSVTTSTTFTFTSVAQPPQPEPNYVWSTSEENFYYADYDGQTYPTGMVVGAYLPQNVVPNQKHTLYFYVTRMLDPIPSLPFYQQAFLFGFCFGVFYALPSPAFPYPDGIHIGVGCLGIFDMKIWHIGFSGAQFSKDFSFSATYPEISYPSFASIPQGAWDGPYVAYVTVSTGYVVHEIPLSMSAPFLVIVMLSVLVYFHRKRTPQLSHQS